MNENVLLFGHGRIAKAIIKLYPEIKVVTHKDIDIKDKDAVSSIIKKHNPSIIINCAALTDVEYCEKNTEEAWEVNVKGVRNISEEARKIGAFLVHFSSSYAIDPANEYSWTKLASESLVDGLVIRTDIYDESFWMLKSLLNKEKVKLLTTRYFNPISVYNLVKITFQLIEKKFKGVINIGTKDKINFYDFGMTICDVFNLDKGNIIKAESIGGVVKRSNNLYLSTKSLINLGINPPTIEEDLRDFENFIQNENKKSLESGPSKMDG